METAAYIFAIFGLFLLPLTLYLFPNFYLKIRENKKYDLSFRYLLFFLVLITEIWFYLNHLYLDDKQNAWQNWQNYFWLEFCNFSAFTIMILLIKPNKLFMDCTLPLGLIGPCATVFFPANLSNMSFTNYWYWQDMFGHITIFFSYLFLYTYGYTKTRFDKTFIQRSIVYTTIIGLGIEVYNLGFGTSFGYKAVAEIFIGQQKEIYYFLFVISWIWPLLFTIFYLIIWYFKPIYSLELKQKINDSWWEKISKKIVKHPRKQKSK
ncbi:hypothetical protein SSYRP_v1c07010 [Spiroplasma syrphidicola EA-1]|uniref:Uncharacterized protein n=1 Tax=Spiroplasma syrphidicola EA-1 TaxID=1276229 RepID=R4UM33_9MOLU|nr:YwaF family protein [Spiroplasma syrphidicola]AGM26291.1 hypothetical protein SSYRP_v1c07010 [Spiroplasma syrphidicola EA-1]